MKYAVVHDWLVTRAGSEKVLEAITEELNPEQLFTLIYRPEAFANSPLGSCPVTTSFLDKLPLSKSKHQLYLPLMPFAVEQLDLSGYDVVVSSCHAVAKGILTGVDQTHICYCHTPIRYVWDLYHQYLRDSGLETGLRGQLAKTMLHRLRTWDYAAAQRPDAYIANSKYVARRIQKVYRRDATVIYPPVDVERFSLSTAKSNYFVAFSRLVAYKKVDLIVQAFNELNLPLVVIGDGPELSNIKLIAHRNIEIVGWQDDQTVARYLSGARALVFAADEDFGIIPVEAQACGTPVVALGRGGTAETVVDGETGVLFPEQTVSSIIQGIRRFVEAEHDFDPETIRRHAELFSRDRFMHQLRDFVDAVLLARSQ